MPPKILVVEDQVMVVELLEMIFKPRGYQLIHTDNGALAIEACKENKPDLILLDVMLPKMSGYSVQTKLLEDDETKNIPIIVLTSKHQIEELFRTAPNVVGFLTKPFAIDELLAKVESIIKNK